MSRYHNRQACAARVLTATERKQRLADEFRQRCLDAAIKRALRHTIDEEFKLERPAP